jgi:competence protein ComEC
MSVSAWSRFPFARITLVFAGGVLAARCWEGSTWIAGGLLGLLLLIYVFIIVSAPRITFRTWSPWLGLLGLGGVFLLGYLRWSTHEVRQDPRHLTHWVAFIEAYEAIALEDAHEKDNHNSVVVAICRARVQGKWKQVCGKVQISLPKHATLQVRYGDVLLIRGKPRAVPASSNPYAFDYAAFLGLSQIYHQQFVTEDAVAVMAHQLLNPLKALSFRVLRYCQSLFVRRIHHPDARAVILALVLGQKDTLTCQVSAAYTRTGTMHVLAVSGLHVGILYWCLGLLLGLLKYICTLRWLSAAISLIVLWFYAFVTGLSPSVLRAVTMFSFMVMASMLGRKRNTYNTLAASAFLLLCWDPMLLFSVSFQLSYLAVLGIVYLQPRIYGTFTLSNRILDKLWLFSSVSIGAQAATVPLSLYYFHQFPTYFVVANWVVVPAALVILCLGLTVLATSFWVGLSALIAWLLEAVVLGVNVFIDSMQKLPYSLIEPIYWSVHVVVLSYGLIVLYLALLHTKRIQYLVAASALAVLLSLRAVQVHFARQAQCKVIFYSIDRHQVTAFIKGRHSTLCVDSSLKVNAQKCAYHLQPSQVALGIISSNIYMLEEAGQHQEFPMRIWCGLRVAVWQGKKFIFLGKSERRLPCFSGKVHTDFLVVEEGAITSLQTLLDRFDFDTLVIGASNQRFLVQKLQKEALKHGLQSHSLSQQGALTVSW